MDKNSKIFVAGHQGLVGSALMRALSVQEYTNIVVQSFEQLDLRIQADVDAFFWAERPEYVFLAAARVGGIKANAEFPAQFLYDNIMITANVINSAYQFGVKKLLFLGSSCIYPRDCPQPIKEDYLLTGPLEKTNEPYAIAKIAGIKLCQSYRRQYGSNFISCMPTNLYGPGDNFDLNNSHVVPALISKICKSYAQQQSEVQVWGTGNARREFLYVDDCARGLIFLMKNYSDTETINIGTGTDCTIAELAAMIKKHVGFTGDLIFDTTKLEGTPQKLLNTEKINRLGWRPEVSLSDGLLKTIVWYKNTYEQNVQKITEKSLVSAREIPV